MKHEISQAEATAIRKAQAKEARRARREAERQLEQRWLDEQELKYGTQ